MRTIKVVAYHTIEVLDHWEDMLEEDGIENDPEAIVEWIETWADLGEYETHRTVSFV